MSKKRFLIALLAALALIFTVFAGCSKKSNPTSSLPTETVESVESLESRQESNESDIESEEDSDEESESESDAESETVALPDDITAPTFSFTLTTTTNTITINEKEDDPYDVGHITAIEYAQNGSDKVALEDTSIRVIEDLYSGVQYIVYVTYTYDIGDGPVSETYKKVRYTVAAREPTVELSYTPITDNSFSFVIDVTDPSNIFNLTEINLLTAEGEEVTSLEDLTQRVFEDVVTGQYILEVCYEYDLNRGSGAVKDSVSITIATSVLALPDFIVEVPVGRDPVILQISDTQIIDATQTRAGETPQSSYYNPDKMEARLFGFLRETITNTKPDLILITGDLVYGKYDDKGTSLLALINAMDSYKIPWAPVFGNHDNESKMGADWQCDQLESSEYCLFKQRELSGNGNYTVGIAQGGKLTRVFFMMDSNGSGAASEESLANGHTYREAGFKEDQVDWFMEIGTQIKELSPETNVSFAFHIQILQFDKAFAKYGFTNTDTKEKPISIDWHPDKAESDFGYIGANLKGPWDTNYEIFNKMRSIGVDSIYVGHEHNINASVVYNGIRYQFSQKISTYDRCNWLKEDGTIVGSFPEVKNAEEIMGGTVNVLDETGAIIDGYVYYCNGIDPTIPPLSYSA